jgi:hypothetical protein
VPVTVTLTSGPAAKRTLGVLKVRYGVLLICFPVAARHEYDTFSSTRIPTWRVSWPGGTESKDGTYGSSQVSGKRRSRSFSEGDFHLLSAVAGQLGKRPCTPHNDETSQDDRHRN